MTQMTHYDTLEVSPRASPEVIRAAYKSLMQRFHPDRNPSDKSATARTVQIATAYAVLSDPAKKALYDESLQPPLARVPTVPAPAGAAAQAATGSASPRRARTAPTPAPRTREGAKAPRLWIAVGVAMLLVIAVIVAVKAARGSHQNPMDELQSIRATMAENTTPESLRQELFNRKQTILDTHPELLPRSTQARVEDRVARTFSLLDAPLVVWVAGGQALGALPIELTIPSISLLVGSFDAPNLLAEMTRHRERLKADLARQLAAEDPRQLGIEDVEQHLARVVAQSVSASLGVAPTPGNYPSTYFESPGRYGVTQVLFPDSFRLVQQRP